MSQSYEEDFRTYIRNLPFTITEHILRGFARSHGFQVSRCCIVRKNMRYGQNPMCSAFLTLHSEAEMWRLIGLLDHQYHPILGPMMLQCEKAVPRIRQWAPAEPAVAQHDEYQDIYPEPETQDPTEYLQDPTEYLQPEPDLDDGALGQALEAAAEQDLGTADGAASETPTEVAPEGSGRPRPRLPRRQTIEGQHRLKALGASGAGREGGGGGAPARAGRAADASGPAGDLVPGRDMLAREIRSRTRLCDARA